MKAKGNEDSLPESEAKIDHTIDYFQKTSRTVIIKDIFDYMEYKNPGLDFDEKAVKFKVLD